VRRHPVKTAPHVQLDGNDGSEAIYTNGLSGVRTDAGDSYAVGIPRPESGSSDSPHTELPELATAVAVKDQFTYFLMFKPDLPAGQAIWVPVAKATWFWTATAKHRGTTWSLSDEKRMKKRKGVATTDFPIYESNVEENEWQELP
jgi:hypothetical protein